MKKRILSLGLALTLAFAFVPATDAASLDTASTWARDGLTAAIAEGFVPSDLQNNYQNTITRAEFCRLAVSWVEYMTGKTIDAVLAEQGKTRDPNAFTDTNDPNILAAFALGITSGIGNNQFNPNGSFTREQAAGMIMNVGKVAGMDTGNIPPSGFADMGSVSSWAADGVNFVRAYGIMQGSNNQFNPRGVYTREQSILTFNNINPNAPPATPVPLPEVIPGSVPARDAVQHATRSVTVSGRAFSVQTITVDIKNPNIGLEVFMPNRRLNNTISFAAATNARKPLAAVNGNFFNAYSAIKCPVGHIMADGEFLYASSGITSIGFTNDNDIIFGMPTVFTDIYTIDNDDGKPAETNTVYEINVLSQRGNQAVLYTPARGSSVAITATGLIIEIIDNTVTRRYNVSPDDTAIIPANGYLLYFNEQVTQLSYFNPLSIGRKVAMRYRLFRPCEEGFDLENSRFILSGAPRLVRSGAIDNSPLPGGFAGDNRFITNSAPRTAAGRLADGRLILASATATIGELKQIMLQLGCTDAVNLDGGGSNAMYYNGSILRSPGRELTSILMILER
jgi:hypothetical protein